MTENKATPEQFKQRPNEDDLSESFDCWWRNEGSAMRPEPKEDLEEHVQRISRIAWLNGAYVVLWHPSTCRALDQAEPYSSLAEEACNAFVQICKANSPTKPENETSAKPDSSLVEQVAIVCAMPAKWTWDDQARAVIHTIANWLDQQELHAAATRLRQEVGG